MALAKAELQPLWKVRWDLWKRAANDNWKIFRDSRIGMLGVVLIIIFGVFTVIHPVLMHTVWDPMIYDPVTGYEAFDTWTIDYQIYDAMNPAPPSMKWAPVFFSKWRAGEMTFGQFIGESLRHPLGTDPIGRDILSQLMFSTREEFILGVLSAIITVIIGTLVGTTAAYYGGVIDTFFMRFADILMLFPSIPFLIVLGAMIELDLFKLALVFGLLSGFGSITVVLKSQAMQIKVRPYIEAARLAGGSHFWVIRRHIIPNVMPLAFLYMMFSVTSAIVSEATLSFFGLLNIRISWGLMIHTMDASGYMSSFAEYWWLWAPAGLAITLFCAAFYMVGRSMDEVVNPRLRKR